MPGCSTNQPKHWHRRRIEKSALSKDDRRSPRSQGLGLLDQGIQAIQIHRFNKVMIESAILAAPEIFLHPKSGQGDAENGLIMPKFLHELDPAAVRQPNIAHQHIEMLVRRRFQSRLDTVRRLDVIPATSEQLSKGVVGVLMIIHQ